MERKVKTYTKDQAANLFGEYAYKSFYVIPNEYRRAIMMDHDFKLVMDGKIISGNKGDMLVEKRGINHTYGYHYVCKKYNIDKEFGFVSEEDRIKYDSKLIENLSISQIDSELKDLNRRINELQQAKSNLESIQKESNSKFTSDSLMIPCYECKHVEQCDIPFKFTKESVKCEL